MRIRTEPLREFSVADFFRMRSVIDLDPPYQREGDVWKPDTRAVLIDSILNGLDLPKIYFEETIDRRKGPTGLSYQYAVIDGKQRLGAILDFAHGNLALADDFYYFEDETVNARGLNLDELDDRYPKIADRFWAFTLPVVLVHANSGDLIEEMFQRLNASTSLNAAEKRNSIQSPTKEAANRLAEHDLLTNRSPIRSARYKYRELAAKFLAIEHQLAVRGKIYDTKAATLLGLFRATRDANRSISDQDMADYENRASTTLDEMNARFDDNDPLLRSIGTVVVYYIAFREPSFRNTVDRTRLLAFEAARREAASMSDAAPLYAEYYNVRLREYNILVQSTNDGAALSRRAAILAAFVSGWSVETPTHGLQILTDDSIDVPDDDAEV